MEIHLLFIGMGSDRGGECRKRQKSGEDFPKFAQLRMGKLDADLIYAQLAKLLRKGWNAFPFTLFGHPCGRFSCEDRKFATCEYSLKERTVNREGKGQVKRQRERSDPLVAEKNDLRRAFAATPPSQTDTPMSSILKDMDNELNSRSVWCILEPNKGQQTRFCLDIALRIVEDDSSIQHLVRAPWTRLAREGLVSPSRIGH